MRREVLEQSLQNILNDINETNIVRMIEDGLQAIRDKGPQEANTRPWIDIGSLTDYLGRISRYDHNERYIIDVLKLSDLTDSTIWQSQLLKTDLNFVYSTSSKLRQATDLLPKIIKLLDRDYKDSFSDKNDSLNENGMLVQTVILSDEGDSLSSPDRIVELLNAITSIYGVVADINGMPANSLAVVGLDSGSEKSFDFLGVAKLMQQVREILQWAYNTMAFHKQNVTTRNLQLVGETLGAVQQISAMESKSEITPEQASRLKHSLFSGLERFTATGAYTPEMNKAPASPALTMRPAPRLLTAPADEIIREANSAVARGNVEGGVAVPETNPTVADDDLTQEQIDAVLDYLTKKAATQGESVKSQKRLRRPARKP